MIVKFKWWEIKKLVLLIMNRMVGLVLIFMEFFDGVLFGLMRSDCRGNFG